MKVIVCAGGTGGHIYPALAIINTIRKREPSSEILYIGTTDRMEKDIIPSLGIKYEGLEIVGLDRKNILNNIKVFDKFIKSKDNAKRIIKEFDPDIVIGVGGYVTVPVLSIAHKLGYKTIIHEQNSIPGLSNRYLSKKVDKVCISLEDSAKYFPKDKVIFTGNPRSEEIESVKPADKKKFGLLEDKKLVLIVMGSLGSKTMTEKIKKMIPKFDIKDYQVIIVTGNAYFDTYKNLNRPKNVAIVPFLDDFLSLLKKTDLIVSRAGASTIAEITSIGLPSILVPSPYVTNNHQYLNAKTLEDRHACKIITEEDFNDTTLLSAIDEILNDKAKYNEMSKAAKRLSVKDSSNIIYNEIKKLIKEDR